MNLRTKLLLAVVPVVATALLTLGGVVYVQLREGTDEDLRRRMDLLLVQTEERVQSLADTMAANARLFANSDLIERYVREEDEGERYELMQPALLSLFSSYRDAYPSYREIRLLLPDGFEDTRSAAPGLANLVEEEGETSWFRDALAAGGTYRSVMHSADDGAVVRLVVHPISIADRDVDPTLAVPTLRGMLAVTAELDELEWQVRRQRIGRSGYLQVLDDRGTVLFASDRSRIGTSLPDIAAAFDAEGMAGQHTLNGESGLVHGRRLADGLLLIAVMPDSESAIARRRLAITVATLTLAATTIVAALVILLLDGLVLRPLRLLRLGAHEIGDGRLDASPVFASTMRRRSDEIGALAGAFDEMRDKLRVTLDELRGSHARIEELAFRDSLTGLPNRRSFLELTDSALVRAAERGGRVALLFLDLDDFKRINDTLGHDAGDELLQGAATRLRALLPDARPVGDDGRGTDGHGTGGHGTGGSVCRLGGDEFTVILPISGAAEIDAFAARVVATLSAPLVVGGCEVAIGTSVGVAVYPDDGGSREVLVKCADTAMYEAKRVEGSLWRRFDRNMQATLLRAQRLESDLRAALEHPIRWGLVLHYQPQLRIDDGRLVGVEALVRWQHPELGRIGPDEFVPLAERTGMIRELGLFVLEAAAAQWARWSDAGLGPVRMSVNVSPRQFALGDVQMDVERILAAYAMPARSLELELTESCMMEAPETVVATLQSLRRLGVRVAMDDFGTGYSSLAVLLELPVDTLKIDRSFVTGLAEGTPREPLVHAILSLARTFGLEVVAEGVETESELAFLRAAGCDLAQGYLLGRPSPDAVVTASLVSERVARDAA